MAANDQLQQTLDSLPRSLVKRVVYLRKLQDDYSTIEDSHEKELREIEKKYRQLYGDFFHLP